MKKSLTLALVGAMLAATSITAFAENTNVSYNVDPSYTVSIPAAVTLGDAAVTADITASNVILEDGKQIKVDLTAASNTASGSTFNAKNGGSTVTYTITGDSAIAVGDTVATFTADGSKTLTFSAADKSAATAAGAHTETLTFNISVEDAAYVPKTFTSLSDGDILRVGDTLEVASGEYIFPDDGCSLMAWNAPFTVLRANVEGLNDPAAMPTVTEDVNGAYYVIKGNENNYFVFEGRLAATDTSDGVIITKNGSNWAINVYEP